MLPVVYTQQNKITQFFPEDTSSFIQSSYNDTIEKIKRFKERVKELDREYVAYDNGNRASMTKKNKKKKLPPLSKRNKEEMSKNNSPATEDLYQCSSLKEIKEYICQQNQQPKSQQKIVPIKDELYKRLLNYRALPSTFEIEQEEKRKRERTKSPLLAKRITIKSNYVESTLSSKNKVLDPIIKSQKSSLKYSYVVYSGNNKELIQRCMKTRSGWEEKQKEDAVHANFIWAPLSSSINFSVAKEFNQWVNHFEYNSEISNKKKLFINLIKYCERYSIDLLSFVPLTIIIPLSNPYYSNQINAFEKLYYQIDRFTDGDNANNKASTSIENEEEKESKKAESKIGDFFIINYSKRLGNLQRLYIPSTHYNKKNLWMIKPVNLNRGRGIKIEHDINKIITEMNQLQQEKKVAVVSSDEANENEKFGADYIILQKYIERPLLYNKRKFDIRMWVLITDKNDGYVFKEGHLKETCVEYNLDSNALFVHLTNYSVQKHHNNFSKNAEGNEISFAAFQAELDKKKTNVNFKRDIYKKICKIIKTTILAAKTHINLIGRKNCFEIFGYDFLIDCDYNPFLIEINTNPGLEESSPLIKMLIPRMINDALKLTIDIGFNSLKGNGINNANNVNESKDVQVEQFEVEGYLNDENMWEKLI